MMMMRILDTFSIKFPIVRVSPYSYNSIFVSIWSFDFFLLLLCSTILMSHSCCSPIFSLLYLILFLVRCWFGEDGYGRTRFSFSPPGRSWRPVAAAALRRRERDDNKSGRWCSAPYLPQHTVPAVPLEGTRTRTVGVLFPFYPLPRHRPGINKRSENTTTDGLATKKQEPEGCTGGSPTRSVAVDRGGGSVPGLCMGSLGWLSFPTIVVMREAREGARSAVVVSSGTNEPRQQQEWYGPNSVLPRTAYSNLELEREKKKIVRGSALRYQEHERETVGTGTNTIASR